MKDHEIREAINELRDVAIKYRDAEQLRSRIAAFVHSIVSKCRRDFGLATNNCDISVWPVRKFKKVEDLKIGDRIKIISSHFFLDHCFSRNCPTGHAKIMNIGLDEEEYPTYELHFEGDYKGSTYGVNLMSYQTEYEVLGNNETEKLNNVLKGSPNKQTLSNPSDYAIPIYFE